ncbi:Phosphatidylserine/phosphatidylglycerophosphate/cardiolipin synthase [Pseudooceanicola nitratireducens]|jgi:phosphatidylserine/phosphatidylglycerophosphate/cardiolipin synthase-like enzyme|uniref:Phospholipase D n=1 Tax=Pseudooceanicola nitratireducens TaxID=517719 RepID=A0A1I1JMB0_9RHOB|nr:phospholipase D family protein [Pseudooceanicola nitratireducens]SEJ53596.1 Phosphatidylserine/phosphatidylglycerophosphate/cardiolipin synthase [Pseudooceanicola nitratireducens]SFC49749.1 Phosphatidylserine/phosphatidylglycerophosphate/cardiolipin synthase [Pseudooceanicola nitratireducens]
MTLAAIQAETKTTGAQAAPWPALNPLITAAEMFPALEQLVLDARAEVLLAFRIFDARTGLRSHAAQSLGLKTWADLFAHVAERDVTIRLLLADFDPVFTADLHHDAWISAGRFAARVTDHPNAEIICSLHDCTPAPIWGRVFGPQIRKRLEKLRNTPQEHLTALQLQALNGRHRLRPVTLHQKFAVADGTRAIIGGIDVDERRWDDHDHDQSPDQTWHDVSMQVSGPITHELRRHFACCWDRARVGCGTVFSARATVLRPLPVPVAEAPASTGSDGDRLSPPAPRLLRTVSTHGTGPLHFGPVTEVKEHEDTLLKAFTEAERSVYIETQFFRHLPLARALAARAREVPDLQMTLVIPTEPERVIFDRASGTDARHAQALQLRCFGILRRAFGDRLAIVSPVQPRPADPHTPMPVKGAGIIYLHSKVTLIDERIGIVGSANLNGRSLLWDTEASVLFQDPAAIRHLRQRLATKWLGRQVSDADSQLAATWFSTAKSASELRPEDRDAMILPYPAARNRRFASYIPILPSAMF